MMGICEYCGKTNDLRPYGKNGENICYKCGMANINETRSSFNKLTTGRDIIVSDDNIEVIMGTEH